MNEITDKAICDFYGEYESPRRLGEGIYRHLNFKLRRNEKMIKKDCFAYRKARCSVLTEMVCKYGECSFYKTMEQDKADREKYRLSAPYKPKGDVS